MPADEKMFEFSEHYHMGKLMYENVQRCTNQRNHLADLICLDLLSRNQK